ncbi:MAG: phosphatase PAP2 family protein [Magnetococcales bacterium]|nr:phosphatase PAP2 family protein [Magnetococcales bacterium]
MRIKPSILWVSLSLLLILLLETTGVDLIFQDLFFQFDTHQWWIDKDDPFWRAIFYTGAKRAIAIVGILTLLALLYSWRFHTHIHWRRKLALLLVTLIVVPGTISGLKNISNVHCPWSLARYGGDLPHVPFLATNPDDFPAKRPGKCFPAGHPSGGFAFMVLFFLLPAGWRWVGLATGVTLGWIMGLYQMMKGAHYLSHVIVSMLLAWLLIEGIMLLFDQNVPDGGKSPSPP